MRIAEETAKIVAIPRRLAVTTGSAMISAELIL